MADFTSIKRICDDIADDMAADAAQFDGRAFNGRTVAEYFGNQGAAIAGLARLVKMLAEEHERLEVATHGGR